MQMLVLNKLLFDRFLKNQIISRITLIYHFPLVCKVVHFRPTFVAGRTAVPLVKGLSRTTQNLDREFIGITTFPDSMI